MQISQFEKLTDLQAAHIVLDLETLSTQPDALVLSIGAVALNKHGQVLPASDFHLAVDQHEQHKRRHTDPDTVAWWKQNTCDQAKAASFSAPTARQAFVTNALDAFSDYVDLWASRTSVCIWGNGCSFDNVILGSLYQDWHKTAPWKYWNDRDMRTITAIFPALKLIPFEGIKHHALFDAKHEAKQLAKAIPLLQSLKPTPEEVAA